MRKYILSALALLLSATAWAVDIPVEHRVRNRPPGYCAWCCLDTLGRNQDIPALVGLAKKRELDPDFVYGVQIGHNTYQWFRQPKHYGSRLAVQVKLDELKVKYRITGNDMSHVAQAAKATGCMVFIKPGAYGSEGHAVLVTDTTDKTVRILDPNTVQEEVVNKDWFLYYWDGLALTVTK